MRQTLFILVFAASASALAQSPVPVLNDANIDSSGAQYQGNFGVNQAAGDGQQQANARAIVTGHQATATTQIRQRQLSIVDPNMGASASIQGYAFSHGSGALGSTKAPAPRPSRPMPCASASVHNRKASMTASCCNKTWR